MRKKQKNWLERLEDEVRKPPPRKRGETTLEYRMRTFGVPPVHSAPIGNNCVVWRLPPLTKSKGGLIIPEAEASPNYRALLIAMGPGAMKQLIPNGIEVGHIVVIRRFSGWEREDLQPGAKAPSAAANQPMIMSIDAKDIIESDDLKRDLEAGKKRFVLNPKTGDYVLEKKASKKEIEAIEKRQKQLERKEKLERLAANPGASPAEAQAARRLAAKIN